MLNAFSTGKQRLGFAALLLLSSFARGQEDAAVVADNKVVRGSLRNLQQKVCKTRVLECRDLAFVVDTSDVFSSISYTLFSIQFTLKNRM